MSNIYKLGLFLYIAIMSTMAVNIGITQDVFPKSDPESQGISSEALKELSDVISGYVQGEKIVGVELLIIKNGKTILHEVFGWKDKEDKIPMEINTLFNIRSMTKSVTGTAIQMLIEDGKLSLDDPVSKYLPSFDNEKSGKITIKHLMAHRSGLPLSLLMKGFDEYSNLQDIAKEAGERGPDFEPGTDFQYSDTGSDVLGAIIEKVSEVSIDTFIKQRIFEPLGMSDSVMVIRNDDPRTARISSTYTGGKGNWVRYWKSGDKPTYPFPMGSQSIYCTPVDYAKFLSFWMDKGMIGDERILSEDAVEESLKPLSDMDHPTNFPDLKIFYGYMWMLWMKSGEEKPVIFGHNGSDGTWAWVWPDQDLIIQYYTQSRGNMTGTEMEYDIDRLIINPGTKPKVTEIDYKPYLGKYMTNIEGQRSEEYAIIEKNGQLAFETPQGVAINLMPQDEAGNWKLTIGDAYLSFDLDKDGNATKMWIHQPIPSSKNAETPESELENVPDEFKPYIGAYAIKNVPANIEFAIIMQDDHLAFKTPDGKITPLKSPENGKWPLGDKDKEYVIFSMDESGNVTGMTVHIVYETNKGNAPPEPALDIDKVQKYLGAYKNVEDGYNVEIVINSNRLAIKEPQVPMPLELYAPDSEGRWFLRLNPAVFIRFNEDKNGKVVSFSAFAGGKEYVRPKVEEEDQ